MLWLFFMLGFLSCSSRFDPWKESVLRHTNRNQEMAKLSYPASSKHSGIQLEIVRYGEEINGYLNVLAFTIPSLAKYSKEARVIFKTYDEEIVCTVNRLDGGQRLHLNSETLKELFRLMQSASSVTVIVGHFSQTYETTFFEKHLRWLYHFPNRYFPEKIVTFDL